LGRTRTSTSLPVRFGQAVRKISKRRSFATAVVIVPFLRLVAEHSPTMPPGAARRNALTFEPYSRAWEVVIDAHQMPRVATNETASVAHRRAWHQPEPPGAPPQVPGNPGRASPCSVILAGEDVVGEGGGPTGGGASNSSPPSAGANSPPPLRRRKIEMPAAGDRAS